MATYFSLVSGVRKLLTAVVASAGASDADKLVATATNGMLSPSVVPVQLSVVSDASGLKLAGDTASPGASKLYGTDASGSKGWYAQPSGGGSSLALSATQLVGGAASIKLSFAAAAIADSVRLVRWDVSYELSYELLLNTDYRLLDAQSLLLKHGLLPSDVFLVQYWARQSATPAATVFSALSSSVAWNPADKSASIALSANNTLAAGQSGVRGNVRATHAITVPSYWETIGFFTTIGGDLVAGMALAAMPLSDWLGQTANSVSGPYVSTGNCYYNGTIQINLGALPSGQRIGHAYDPVSGTYRVTLNGATWITVNKTGGLSGTFYPAATLNSVVQSMLFVANPADMFWSPPPGHTAGVS